MLRMFSFLPPIGFYVLAILALVGTYSVHTTLLASGAEVDMNKVWLVGGIIAFLLGFGGFQKSLENREKARKPTVSSADVMQKLTPTETGKANPDLDIPPEYAHGPEANSPLGRLRARSRASEILDV